MSLKIKKPKHSELKTLPASADNVKKLVFWFRRDLRLNDNRGLFEALSAAKESGAKVIPLFIYDTDILKRLEDRGDRRAAFIHQTLASMSEQLRLHGSELIVEIGTPNEVFNRLTTDENVKAVYLNHDYEPYAIERDERIARLCSARKVDYRSFKDQVIFERKEVTKDDGKPYVVFTPYSKKWKANLEKTSVTTYPSEKLLSGLAPSKVRTLPTLEQIGFIDSSSELDVGFPRAEVTTKLLSAYADQRNTPSVPGTSKLGVHLRFGTVSIRDLVGKARKHSDVWLSELIWREFFMQVLWHSPHVIQETCRPEYRGVQFRHDKDEFQKWCDGQTGYPLVDAGMRELNATGFMHNRVRMIAASFLVKHLLIDYRWGEAYFARKLLDFDLASNNGNWQWVAGTGCDAAPYFRVFNPAAQEKKFDRSQIYIKRWVPEVETPEYPAPIVGHVFARTRIIETFKKSLAAYRA